MYDKYVIDGLIRNDGSSLFGADERRQWYYRIAGAWRLGQEDFFNIPGVDEFKLRYAIGTAGGRPRFEAQYETYERQRRHHLAGHARQQEPEARVLDGARGGRST